MWKEIRPIIDFLINIIWAASAVYLYLHYKLSIGEFMIFIVLLLNYMQSSWKRQDQKDVEKVSGGSRSLIG
jgi:hypothetical protein